MRVTLQQIAERAGVSVSTVSRVMNRRPNVNAKTVDKVLQALQELGLSDSGDGKNGGRRSGIVGFLVPQATEYQGLQTPIMLAEIGGAKGVLEAQGYGLLVGTYAAGGNGTVVDEMIQRGELAGVLVARTRVGEDDLRPFLEHQLPFVLINTLLDSPGMCCVGVDNVQVGYLATRHLLELGHKRIGFIGGPSHFYSVNDRLAGYRRALEEAGLAFSPSLVAVSDLTESSGRAKARELLEREEQPTAIMAINDYLAIGALEAAANMGLSVPDDVAIVGCDDIELTRYVRPTLTTVRIPWRDLAATAASLIVQAIQARNLVRACIELDVELVVRESTQVQG
ncbi:MAG: LacI family DNA-binding transcriptional regulator [Limnochordia bacterium]|jgi:DNA-binding LacI/PurR family transcriptional regulator